ncbi:MAG TPA: hypothetical protein DEA62_00730 [Coxiellaceae bacterium]|nr:hypothetical protein [Coxiellaceae bacterium]HBY56089.1 hypothetical protein [Coxiellaceae bacterium]
MKKYLFIVMLSIASIFAFSSIYAGNELAEEAEKIINTGIEELRSFVECRNTYKLVAFKNDIDRFLLQYAEQADKTEQEKFKNRLYFHCLKILQQQIDRPISEVNIILAQEVLTFLNRYKAEKQFYLFITDHLSKPISQDIVVLIVGSGGGLHPQQEIPEFCVRSKKSSRCFNLDSDFVRELPAEKMRVTSTRHEFYFPGKHCITDVDTYDDGYFPHDIADHEYKELRKELFKKFTQTLSTLMGQNKHVVLVSHASASMFSWFYNVGHDFSNEIGKKLHVIGAYFDELPAIVFGPKIFEYPPEKATKVMQSIVSPIIGNSAPHEERVYSEGDHGDYIGTIFPTYSKITPHELFNADYDDDDDNSREKPE